MEEVSNDSQEMSFNPPPCLLKLWPPLASNGFWTPTEVEKYFGIDQNKFAPIPSRLVVPILDGHGHADHTYHTYGWLYILEPQEWIPLVTREEMVRVSAYQNMSSKVALPISEAQMYSGADCKASISLQAVASDCRVTIRAIGARDIHYEPSSASTTEEDIKKKGYAGDFFVEQFVICPILRCKAIKRQRISYTVNDSSKELKWSEKSSEPGYWERIRVRSSRLERVKQMQINPVPVRGGNNEEMSCLLPIHQTNSNGDLEITTLISHKDWTDWYIYESKFQDCSKTIDLAASQNNVAFRPTSSWTTWLEDHQIRHGTNDGPKKSQSSGDPDKGNVDSNDDEIKAMEEKDKREKRNEREKRREQRKKVEMNRIKALKGRKCDMGEARIKYSLHREAIEARRPEKSDGRPPMPVICFYEYGLGKVAGTHTVSDGMQEELIRRLTDSRNI